MTNREISLQDAADARGLRLRTLQAAAKRGRLKARRVAGVWLVTLPAVDRWLANAEHRPGPKPGSIHGNGGAPELAPAASRTG
jgi:hypothetical protein